MNDIIIILAIQFCVITIMDITPFWSDLTKCIYEKLNPGKQYNYKPFPKPFGCSFCMSFWIIFIFLTTHHNPLFYSIAISLLSTYVFLINKIILKRINDFFQQYL